MASKESVRIARKHLREAGLGEQYARTRAPQLAEKWEAQRDQGDMHPNNPLPRQGQ